MIATDYRYLVKNSAICGGRTIVEGTRIGVHDVVGLIANGAQVFVLVLKIRTLALVGEAPDTALLWIFLTVATPPLVMVTSLETEFGIQVACAAL